MGFNVEIRDKEGNAVDWKRLDKEVCELWGIPENPDQWATAPGKDSDDDWNEFLGYGVMFMRGFHEDRCVFNPISWSQTDYLDIQATLDYREHYPDHNADGMSVFYWYGQLDRNGILRGKLQLRKDDKETY